MIKINANIQKLENKQKELLINLSVEEIEVYVKKLSKNYFSSFLNNDKTLYSQTVDQLKELIKIYEFEHPNLYIYVNACLLNAINKILADNLQNNFKPTIIYEVTFEDTCGENGFQALTQAFAKSRAYYFEEKEKETRIKERLKELEQENQQLKARLNNK